MKKDVEPTGLRFSGAWLAVWLLIFSPLTLARSLCLTFDDGFDPTANSHAAEWNESLLTTLRTNSIKAMIFPTLRNVGTDAGLALVEKWGRAGHWIGNHTTTHRSLSAPGMTADEFIADVVKAESALKALPNFKQRLRFPYLNEGDDATRRDGIRSWMKSAGYRPAPVSIDASDWYYSQVFVSVSGSGDTARLARLKKAYVEHLLDRANYYDGLATQYIGRSPAHVILLHTNALNADALPEVIEAFRGAGWTIISPEEAFADSLYEAHPTALPAGQSILWALAKQGGARGLRYPAEDARYEEPGLRRVGILE